MYIEIKTKPCSIYDLEDWLSKNMKGKYYENKVYTITSKSEMLEIYGYSGNNRVYRYNFELEEDALKFKLTWG